MKTQNGTFEVTEVNGTKVNQKFPYEFKVFESFDETKAAYSEKDLLELVNAYEKSTAKANEYQKVTKPFRPDPNDPAVKRENLIKNLVSTFGVPRNIAEQQIDAMIAASKVEEKPAEVVTQ